MTPGTHMSAYDLAELEEHLDHTSTAHAQDALSCYRALRQRCPITHSDRHGGFW